MFSFANHVRSKKHRDNVALLKEVMAREDERGEGVPREEKGGGEEEEEEEEEEELKREGEGVDTGDKLSPRLPETERDSTETQGAQDVLGGEAMPVKNKPASDDDDDGVVMVNERWSVEGEGREDREDIPVREGGSASTAATAGGERGGSGDSDHEEGEDDEGSKLFFEAALQNKMRSNAASTLSLDALSTKPKETEPRLNALQTTGDSKE